MSFRLVSTSVTLNDLKRHNNPYFAFFSQNLIALQAHYITVVKDRRIMSAKYRLPVPVFHFRPKVTHPALRSLYDSWATCKTTSQPHHSSPITFKEDAKYR